MRYTNLLLILTLTCTARALAANTHLTQAATVHKRLKAGCTKVTHDSRVK